MPILPSFSAAQLESICNVLADPNDGLTGAEIGALLREKNITDPYPAVLKRHRLFEALREQQELDGCGNNIAAFILAALQPARYTDKEELFKRRLERLNAVLGLDGYQISPDGLLKVVAPSHQSTEAQDRARRLRSELVRRGVHPNVLRCCLPELLTESCYPAVYEATRGLEEQIREKTGLNLEGVELVEQALGLRIGPLLAFNTLQSEAEHAEHLAISALIKNLISVFKSTSAVEIHSAWALGEAEAIDLLTLASMLHRRVDHAVLTRQV
ncbi:TIGR02391 family protein [Longilinea arvoryzae]|uniref:TIGR02391 family protein n=1 Tax=Longilinea arvoryzae TaxID=360412 RepID=A0A0K8MXI5_9CHLR|nr:TIGR02391 family protein [Longilinea arvoryzae]GAP15959.1 TIGR02391 family protein [Longilinea arvoryzae]